MECLLVGFLRQLLSPLQRPPSTAPIRSQKQLLSYKLELQRPPLLVVS